MQPARKRKNTEQTNSEKEARIKSNGTIISAIIGGLALMFTTVFAALVPVRDNKTVVELILKSSTETPRFTAEQLEETQTAQGQTQIAIQLLETQVAIALTQTTSVPTIITPPRPLPTTTTHPNSGICGNAQQLGPWEPGSTDIHIDATNGWIHADLWSPNTTLKVGYDEVSVLFTSGKYIITMNKNVGGSGWKYDLACTQTEIERQMAAHQTRRVAEGKRITTVTVNDLQEILDLE